MPIGNAQANLKYELSNMRPNSSRFDDELVYKENSFAINCENESIMKRLAKLDTNNYIVHLASKLKHNRSCPLYKSQNQASYTETVLSSVRTISSQKSAKPIVNKNVQFNLKQEAGTIEEQQLETDYGSSEYMESIYIHGYKS